MRRMLGCLAVLAVLVIGSGGTMGLAEQATPCSVTLQSIYAVGGGSVEILHGVADRTVRLKATDGGGVSRVHAVVAYSGAGWFQATIRQSDSALIPLWSAATAGTATIDFPLTAGISTLTIRANAPWVIILS